MTGFYQISLKECVLDVKIGILETEQNIKQRITIDLTLTVTKPPIFNASNIVYYNDVYDYLRQFEERPQIAYLEELAQEICAYLLKIDQVHNIALSITKNDIFDGKALPGIFWAESK